METIGNIEIEMDEEGFQREAPEILSKVLSEFPKKTSVNYASQISWYVNRVLAVSGDFRFPGISPIGGSVL